MFETDPISDGSTFATADAIVAEVLAAGPGPRAAATLDAVDLHDLSRKGMVDYVNAWDQLTAWTTSRPMAAMVAVGSCTLTGSSVRVATSTDSGAAVS